MARPRKVRATPHALPIPAKVVRMDPPNLGGIHAQAICVCDDSASYVMKDGTHDPRIPHAEWFCTHLADRVGIPSIPCRILELPPDANGVRKKVFGSRWEAGEIPISPAPWWLRVEQKTIPVSHVAPVLSRIYAFDHFVHNFDRHLKNYFAQKSPSGVSIFSVDYSKAWVCNKFPLPPMPFDLGDSHHRTVFSQRELTRRWGPWMINNEIVSLLSGIGKITKDDVKYIMQTEPDEWLSKRQLSAIVKWWGSAEFKSRIAEIVAGITNGTTSYV
jgi:hypothetical protein